MTETRFVHDFLIPNRPVIVTGVAAAWPAQGRWTPAYLRARFGDSLVQVYDQLFSLVDLTTLADYLERNIGRGDGAAHEYIRWYSQLNDTGIPWADEAFAGLADEWSHPPFLPKTGYLLPFRPKPDEADVTRDHFPYRGIFISGAGGRTRLHRDPLGSQALLWQVFGQKSVTFYAPSDDAVLRAGADFVDPKAPDLSRFKGFATTEPVHVDVLQPGEILFIPDGWFHDVTTLSDSISVTWNLVHEARAEPFLRVLADDAAGTEITTARFFFSRWLGEDAGAGDILDFLRMRQPGCSQEAKLIQHPLPPPSRAG